MTPNADTSGRLSLAAALLGVGLLAIYFSKDIADTGVSAQVGIGPRAFPVGLAVLLLLGGLLELGKSVVQLRGSDFTRRRRPRSSDRWIKLDVGTMNVLLLVVALVLYIAAIPRIGFTLSTWVLATFLLARLGTRWWVAGVSSAVMVASIQMLFYHLFKVQLPSGVFNLAM